MNRHGASFVSTLPPTLRQRVAALSVAVVSLVVFVAAAPLAREPLPPVPAFLPIYQSALVVFDLITSVLLFGQFRILRNRALFLLAAGYLFSAMMAVAHTLSFPGLFAPAGIIGGGSQTTAWIYFAWHAGFPLFVLGYALSKPLDRYLLNVKVGAAMLAAIAMAATLAVGCTLLATTFEGAMPPIMNGHVDAPGKILVALITWLITGTTLVMLWKRKPHSVLDLWLMVVLCVWMAETALAALLNGARFDLGWYSGRIYGLLANGFVLAVLLTESGALYARLARTNRLLAEKSEALEGTMAELEIANRDLQAFAGSLAHDLQQPLAAISAFSQVMEAHADELPPTDAVHLRNIATAAGTARQMIRSLLEFARLGRAQIAPQTVDLNQVVSEARSAVMSTESRVVEWRIEQLPAVRGDASLLLLAFINLLSNAVKYTRRQPHPIVWIDSQSQGEGDARRCVIRVRDNGVGFAMEKAEKLFQPFERLHAPADFEGTGMGLANVRRIMEKHGGSVRAESRPGEGAVFSLQLPSCDAGP